ncbi:solute carrier family 2, facilitated glucose transporter member 12 [Lissotriton helveticus]
MASGQSSVDINPQGQHLWEAGNDNSLNPLPKHTGCGRFIVLSSVVAALSGLLAGYELGIISGALLQLHALLTLTCQEQELVVSSLLIGALLASSTGGFLIDHYGRRITIIMTACLLVLANLFLISIASYGVLIVGRIVIGVSISLSSIATCVYLAEIAPQQNRGLLVSLNELMIVVGVLLAYVSNYIFSTISHGWQYMFGLIIPVAAVQALAVYFLPPSPRFLIRKGHDEDASKVLKKLRATSNTSEELTSIKSSIKAEHQYTFFDLFRSNDNMRSRMLIGLTLVFFVQITGQPNILFYASTVLKSVGFQSNEAASLASTGVGIVKVVSTVPATLLVDKVGSRTFLCIGSAIMAVSLATLSLVSLNIEVNIGEICKNYTDLNQSLEIEHFPGPGDVAAINMTLKQEFSGSSLATLRDPLISNQNQWNLTTAPQNWFSEFSKTERFAPDETSSKRSILKWLCLSSLLVFVAAFSISLGPMAWLVLSEIFPVGIKGRAFALTSVMNWGMNLLISLTFLTLTELIGLPWMFFMYSVMSLASLGFTILFVPETKGRSLEEISEELAKKSHVYRWKRRRKTALQMEPVQCIHNQVGTTE